MKLPNRKEFKQNLNGNQYEKEQKKDGKRMN